MLPSGQEQVEESVRNRSLERGSLADGFTMLLGA